MRLCPTITGGNLTESVNQPLTGLCNGVNFDKLVSAIEGVKSDPSNGALVFRTHIHWHGGFRVTHTTQRVTMDGDTTDSFYSLTHLNPRRL